MAVKLDPDAEAVYQAFQQAGRPPYEAVTPEEARQLYLAGTAASRPEPPELASVTDCMIPGPAGEIEARIFTPKTLRQQDGLSPGLVYFHGGGWVIGDLDSHDTVCRALAVHGELIVVAVHYRLAPEHKFPAAVDDAIAATKWLSFNASVLEDRCLAALCRRRQRRRQSRRGGVDRCARPGRPGDRRPGADLSRHRFCDDASLAQRARDQRAADAFGDPLVSRPLSQRRA